EYTVLGDADWIRIRSCRNPVRGQACIERVKGGGTPPMQNSPGIPLAALVVAIALATITMLSVIAGVGGGVALNELQLGATAWALALGLYGLEGIVSIVVEGRQVLPGTIEPRLSNPLSAVIAALSVLLFALAGLTGVAIVS